jgi:D-alanyl-D-alanine carboxypeptidase (penicillin-binding protein 5/6)
MNIREPGHYHLVRRARTREGQKRQAQKIFKALVVLVVVATLVLYGSYSRSLPTVKAQVLSPAPVIQNVTLTWPTDGQAAVGVLGEGVLATSGTQNARPIASVAKVMLALAVLKKHPLAVGQQGPMLTITSADVELYNTYTAQDGTGLRVEVGEQISEYQALQATLLPSANNAADMLAIWAYGSLSAYHTAANQLAASIGMKQSHFAGDASGFSAETVSTPEDLVIMGEAALQNPVIKEIVAQPTADLPIVGTVSNVNWLLGRYGIIGIKTGNTDAAGGVFLTAATRTLANNQQITVVAAVVAAPTLQAAMISAQKLLISVYAGYKSVTVVHKGDILARYHVPWQGATVAVASQDITVFAWAGSSPRVTVLAQPLISPKTAGTVVGSARVGDQSSPLVLSDAVQPASTRWRIWRH